MPRGRAAAIETESDEDFDETQTQQTQSLTQAQRAVAQLSPEVVDRKVCELVQYFLIQEQRKIPIKRSDVNKKVLPQEYRQCFHEIMQQAKTKLNQVYGLDLVELNHTTGKSITKVYVLLNTLSSEAQGEFIDSSNEDPKVALLFIILGLIFMHNGVVPEAVLWHFLKKLGLNQDDKNHEVFGDIKRLVSQDFARQLYLEYTRIANSDPPAYDFRWGARAKESVSKMKVLQFIGEIYNMEPSLWVSQWQEACAAEGINPDVDPDEEVVSD